MGNKEEKILEKYDTITIRSHSAHKNFMRRHFGKYFIDEGLKQCSSRYSDKCQSRSGFWKVKDFYKSNNEIFDGHFPICKHCLHEITNNNGKLSKKELIRICVVFDIPFLQSEYESAIETNSSSLGAYFRNIMLNYKDARFVDSDSEVLRFNERPDNTFGDDIVVDDELYLKWGAHLPKEDIMTLEHNYIKMESTYQIEGLVEEEYLKIACHLLLDMNKQRAEGKSTDKTLKQYTDVLNKLRLNPSQQGADTSNLKDVGMIIKQIETTRPVWSEDKKLKDVDGMMKYVDRFLTHIVKNFGKYNPKDGD